MAVIRKHPRLLSAMALCAVVILGIWMFVPRSVPSALADGNGYSPLDPPDAAAIDALRGELGLDDSALVALDLSDEQLETLLAAVRGWYENNSDQLKARWSALADQRAQVRRLRTAIAMGIDAANDLAAARTRLAQLIDQHESYITQTRGTVTTSLSNEQRALAVRMQEQAHMPMPYRALALSNAQRADLAQTQTTYRKRLAVATERGQRAQLHAAYQQELDTLLGPSNTQQVAVLRGYITTASERVVSALDRVLPVIDEDV